MLTPLNSLRMRAQRAGRHISGAERLLTMDELGDAAVAMLQRALDHPRGAAEQISFHVEAIAASAISSATLLNFTNNPVDSWQQGRQLASQLLVKNGLSSAVAARAIKILTQGAAPDGQSMRGAMLIDADSGERLETDQARGVRASRMDLTSEIRQELGRLLEQINLNNPHVVEALTLASKVCSASGIIAELCWSDDPDYLAGYVASREHGYQRISLLKPVGEERGGRAFFVRKNRAVLPELVAWLEQAPLLFVRIGKISGSIQQGDPA